MSIQKKRAIFIIYFAWSKHSAHARARATPSVDETVEPFLEGKGHYCQLLAANHEARWSLLVAAKAAFTVERCTRRFWGCGKVDVNLLRTKKRGKNHSRAHIHVTLSVAEGKRDNSMNRLGTLQSNTTIDSS
jgi:hypothetical protein